MIFQQYKRKGLSEMTKWTKDMDITNVSISKEDIENGSPKDGDMIARNHKNHNDMWLVAKQYFNDNLELASVESELDKKAYTITYKSGWDTITEDVSINDIIKEHKAALSFAASEVGIYAKDWSNEFSINHIKKAAKKIPSQLNNDIDFSALSRDDLYSLGFGNWDGKLVTIPLVLWEFIKPGAELISISGKKAVKGTDYIDLDTRFRCIAYGFIKD